MMLKSTCIALLMALGIAAYAEDTPNVLWEDNGENIKLSPENKGGGWRTKDFTVERNNSGEGFIFKSTVKPRKSTTGRYVTVSPEYPWFCWKISNVKPLTGYKALTMNFMRLDSNELSMVSKVFPGYYAVNIAQNSRLKKKQNCFLRVDQHGYEITFDYMKLVEKPDYYINVDSESITAGKAIHEGEEVTFTLNLKNAAEDASLTFYKTYTMPRLKIDGKSVFSMKPVDQSKKVWNATVKFSSIVPLWGKGKPFPRNGIIVKADVELENKMISVLTSMPAPIDMK